MAWYTETERAVNVNWNDDGWNVNANAVENPNEWNEGNQVFSRNSSIFFFAYERRSFFFYCFTPPIEHAASFF